MKGAWRGLMVGLAWWGGSKLGEKLDEETGWSDDIAGWLEENIPDGVTKWLSDLF